MASVDYGKKTNSELQELLKARSLPHTGRKAELVSRLQEDDKAKEEAATAAPATTEDVIDWDDEAEAAPGAEDVAAKPSTEAGAAAVAAGGKGQVANPVAVPNQKLGEDPAKTHDLSVATEGAAPVVAAEAAAAAVTGEEKEAEKPAVNYSIGLAASDVDEEMRKLRARAERFGIVEDSQKLLEEKEKALQRAKRFGAGVTTDTSSSVPAAVKGLDQALPEDRPRKRGRGGDEQRGRGGKKQNFGRRDRRSRPNMRVSKGGNSGGNTQAPLSDKDSLAAEARKKRFATATS